jgi:hypothetical protein
MCFLTHLQQDDVTLFRSAQEIKGHVRDDAIQAGRRPVRAEVPTRVIRTGIIRFITVELGLAGSAPLDKIDIAGS